MPIPMRMGMGVQLAAQHRIRRAWIRIRSSTGVGQCTRVEMRVSLWRTRYPMSMSVS